MLFLGETRSEQAKRNGWHWHMGVSTAKVLFDSLREVGITPENQQYANLWSDNGVLQLPQTDQQIIAMGQKVQHKLDELGIEYIGIVHPAARGKWRNRKRYIEQLREKLAGVA
jgi:hypothetical protein